MINTTVKEAYAALEKHPFCDVLDYYPSTRTLEPSIENPNLGIIGHFKALYNITKKYGIKEALKYDKNVFLEKIREARSDALWDSLIEDF